MRIKPLSKHMRMVMPMQVQELGDREVLITLTTSGLARDGHIFVPEGCILDNYRKNPIMLWQHDTDHPVANASDIQVFPDKITARAVFAPVGVSKKADEICGLVKAGVIRAVSVGMDPIETEPLDPKKPRGGQRVLKWEMLENSFCSVPVDTGAVVLARANQTKEKSNMAIGDRTVTSLIRKMRVSGAGTLNRGLYELGNIAYGLSMLGCFVQDAKFEAALEGDGSQVPAMLADALQALAEAFLEMTEEEVKEFLAGHDIELVDDPGDEVEIEVRDLPENERAYIASAKSPLVRSWRRGLVLARAGKALSATNKDKLDEADGHLDRAAKHQRALGEHHEAVGNDMTAVRAEHGAAVEAHAAVGKALDAAAASPEDAAKHLKRAATKHKALGDSLATMDTQQTNMADRHQDVGDAHRALGRSMKSGQRCVRAVLDGATAGEDADSTEVQTVEGTTEKDEGSRSLSFRQRQVDIQLLTPQD